MNTIRASLLACVGCLAISATGARASVDDYSVGANSSVQINLEICSAESQLAAQGSGATDLDFIVSDPSGTPVHTDQGVDDYLSIVLSNAGGECATFGLAVSNLGDESNDFQVVLEPINEASTRVEKYIIGPSATETVKFKACGTSAEMIARGDGDTDLDFIIRNSDGGVVHEDAALEDETTAMLAGLLSDCETFELEVSNLGAVYNALMVMVAPKGASDIAFSGPAPSTSLASGLTGVSAIADTQGPGEYQVAANSSLTVNLPVCGVSRLEIRGDGGTDLDFTINDSTGNTVHSDFDLSDVTYASLSPSLEECETFTANVSNLGEVGNVFAIAVTGEGDLGGVSGTGEYRIEATSSAKVLLRLCDSTMIYARGGGGTDLDFVITDGTGNPVHSDYDLTDQTEFTADPGGTCSDYQMSVSNLGDVPNMLTIAFDDEPDIARTTEADYAQSVPVMPPTIRTTQRSPGEKTDVVLGSGPGEYRAPASDAVALLLPVCERTFLSVEGGGGTDLDFEITASSGAIVHSDFDLTDTTYTSLRPADGADGEGCETFRMSVQNLGDTENVFTVVYNPGGSTNSGDRPSGNATPAASPRSFSVAEDTISTDGNNRNIAVLNQTGEALNFIYWTNSATMGWGDDKLGGSATLATGQQWNVYVGDASDACLFDFRALALSGREIVFRQINVCEVTSVLFE